MYNIRTLVGKRCKSKQRCAWTYVNSGTVYDVKSSCKQKLKDWLILAIPGSAHASPGIANLRLRSFHIIKKITWELLISVAFAVRLSYNVHQYSDRLRVNLSVVL